MHHPKKFRYKEISKYSFTEWIEDSEFCGCSVCQKWSDIYPVYQIIDWENKDIEYLCEECIRLYREQETVSVDHKEAKSEIMPEEPNHKE